MAMSVGTSIRKEIIQANMVDNSREDLSLSRYTCYS
jgi:hypothetical protein